MDEKIMQPLTDDMLDGVAGGTGLHSVLEDKLPAAETMIAAAGDELVRNAGLAEPRKTAASAAQSYCPVCGRKTEFMVMSGGRAYCKVCGTMKEM